MMDPTYLILGGLAYLLLVKPRTATRGPTGPVTAISGPGGFSVSVPGYGGYTSGPGGTAVVLDPRLFQSGFFTSGAGIDQGAYQNVPQESVTPGVYTPYAPEYPDSYPVEPDPYGAGVFGLPDGLYGDPMMDPCLAPSYAAFDPLLCPVDDPSLHVVW